MDTSLEEEGWELESAQDRHAQHPDDFHIPSREELQNLRIGDMVKLLFLFWDNDDPEEGVVSCERMWVTIQAIDDGVFSGQLESMPASSQVLEPLDEIRFREEHVCSIYIRKSDPRHPHYQAENE